MFNALSEAEQQHVLKNLFDTRMNGVNAAFDCLVGQLGELPSLEMMPIVSSTCRSMQLEFSYDNLLWNGEWLLSPIIFADGRRGKLLRLICSCPTYPDVDGVVRIDEFKTKLPSVFRFASEWLGDAPCLFRGTCSSGAIKLQWMMTGVRFEIVLKPTNPSPQQNWEEFDPRMFRQVNQAADAQDPQDAQQQ